MAREHWTLHRVPRQLNGRTSTGAWRAPVATLRSWPGEAANENPDTSSLHLVVERVDVAGHRFVLWG